MGCLKLTYYQQRPRMRCVWGKKRQKKSVQWFYMMDPLAEKYYSISPYAYVANNPLRFIDPTGMAITDYGVTSAGEIIRISDYDNNPDRLFALEDDKKTVKTDVAPITVDDKTILKELSFNVGTSTTYPSNASPEFKSWYRGHRNDGYFHLRYTGTGSREDAFKVYEFASKNSGVEWALSAYNINGSTTYALGTQQSKESAVSFYILDQHYSHSNLVSAVHTHPKGSLLGASGYPGGGSGDLYNFNLAPTKPHYVYDIATSTLFQYNQKSNHFNSQKVTGYKSLMNYVK